MSEVEEQQVAWQAMPYRAPVLDAGEEQIGTAESLLGDEAEDIFHGIVVRRGGHDLEVEATRIKKITTRKVYTDLRPDELDDLPVYREQKWFHLGWGGLFRKHPEWRAGE
jgi:hypothetical protein